MFGYSDPNTRDVARLKKSVKKIRTARRVYGSDVILLESVKRFSCREIPAMTSLPSTLTAKKSMKMTFSSDKIYYNFSQENPKIANI